MFHVKHLKRHWPILLPAILFAILLALIPITAFAQEVTSNTEEINGVPTNLMMWSVLVGFLASPVISAINRYNWSPEAKMVSTFFWSVVAAAGTVLFTGNFDTKNLATTILFVFFTAINSYNLAWKPLGKKIEAATG